MAIDTTPSTVATNALNALDFTALIGGPMDAIIKAQAMAAQTTYEFINEVGLTVDPDTGEKKPVNVTFQYNSNGRSTTLTVPLLVMLTIPNIEVTSYVIDFIANISASSSSVEETSTDTNLGVEAEAEASIGVGPFSLKVKAKASYSSKQLSKAAQDSKYSVEYTMNVKVEGGQGDMPTGLQTVLNILQGSNTSVSPAEMLQVFPTYIDIDMENINRRTLQVVVKDNQGYFAAGTNVTLNFPATNPFSAVNIIKGHTPEDIQISAGLLSNSIYSNNRKNTEHINPKHIISHRVLKPYMRRFKHNLSNFKSLSVGTVSGPITGVTDAEGSVTFELIVDNSITTDQQGTLTITALIPVSDAEGDAATKPEVVYVPYTVLAPSMQGGSLMITSSPNAVSLDATNLSKALTLTIKDMTGSPVGNEAMVCEIYKSDGTLATTTEFTKVTDTLTSSSNGEATFTVTSVNPTVPGTYELRVSNDSSSTTKIPITVS